MNLVVNGSALEIDEARTIADVVTRVAADRPTRGTAVAQNGEVVPRGEWGSMKLSEGDRIEVLHAIGGG